MTITDSLPVHDKMLMETIIEKLKAVTCQTADHILVIRALRKKATEIGLRKNTIPKIL